MSTEAPLNYTLLAAAYHQRYTAGEWSGVTTTIKALAHAPSVRRALEVGCGTGQWLSELRAANVEAVGLDLSFGMLQEAHQREAHLALLCGSAHELPFPTGTFDLVLCVNAFHHFAYPARVISEARRSLRAGGMLAIIGLHPHAHRDRWFIYDYFPETYLTDLQRYPTLGALMDWMMTAGFARAEWRTAERVQKAHHGRAILTDYFLQKQATSQLAQLSDEAYTAGLERIQAALTAAEARGQTLEFPVNLGMELVLGQVE